AVARSSAFDGVADIDHPCFAVLARPEAQLRSGGNPVFQRRKCSTARSRRTGRPIRGLTPALKTHRRSVMTGDVNAGNPSAKPQTPLKRSIPEFPTKVGGHHMSGSTDPARDSSLKDR